MKGIGIGSWVWVVEGPHADSNFPYARFGRVVELHPAKGMKVVPWASGLRYGFGWGFTEVVPLGMISWTWILGAAFRGLLDRVRHMRWPWRRTRLPTQARFLDPATGKWHDRPHP